MHTTHKIDLDRLNYAPPASLQAVYRRAVAVGGVFAVLSLIAFILNPRQAMQAYLVGFMLFLGLTLGPMGMLLTWFMPGGRWGLTMRRIWEAASRNIWVAAIAFIPILIGYKHIYPWAHPESLHATEHMQALTKHYLNFPGFLIRSVVYFLVWFAIVYFINKYSKIQDKPYEGWLGGKLNALGAAGVLAYVWSMSFAAIDWLMSLSPGWPSTIFPLIIVVGQGILGLSIGIIVGRILVRDEPMNVLMDEVVFWDNGKLLLAFVMLWAYFGFSQWLIIWAGNLPEEIHWFLDRTKGGWGAMALFLVVFHFAIPFAILLSQALKKDPRKLAFVAVWMIVMRFFDLFWITAPSINKEHFAISQVWMYPVIAIAMAGIWAALFVRNLMSRPLVAVHDPRLYEIYGEVHE
ncbi:MAG TPA: hypothetical protein VN577_05760 [Terriglobales bacterium]|nr:hypothetical protein [Terriglobales bacterium]